MIKITHYNYRIREIACGEHNQQLGKMFLVQEQPCGVITRRWFKKLDPAEEYVGRWSDDNYVNIPYYNGHWMTTNTVLCLHETEEKATRALATIIAAREQKVIKEVTAEVDKQHV